MRRVGWVLLAVVLAAVGVVWFFQGIGVIKGSFMTGQPIWSVFGVLLIGVAVKVALPRLRTGR